MKNKEQEIMIKSDKPAEHNITFHDKDDKEIGRLEWGTGVLVFKGAIDESAKVFFKCIKNYIDPYINTKEK